MRHDVYVVMPLDGSSHGYGAGTAADAEALHDAPSQVLVHILAAVVGNVDVCRVEFPERIYGMEQPIYARSL